MHEIYMQRALSIVVVLSALIDEYKQIKSVAIIFGLSYNDT